MQILLAMFPLPSLATGLPLTQPRQTVVLGPPQFPTDRIPAFPLDCAQERFEFVTSLKKLPSGMAEVLGQGAILADGNEEFNSTDAMRIGVPGQHFVAAAVGQKQLFAAVETGGISLVTEYWAFKLIGTKWVGSKRWAGGDANGLGSILAVACKQSMPVAHFHAGNSTIDCSFGRSRMVILGYTVHGRREDYELRPRNRADMTATFLDIRDATTNHRPSISALNDLRETLRDARLSMKHDDQCRYEVDIFLLGLQSLPDR